MHNPQIREITKLQGVVERITFHNPENGFCVLRVKVNGYQDLITIVGNAPAIAVGEHIECVGEWYQDKVYGQQFKANQSLKTLSPNTLEGIENYLGSGLIKGIGPKTAKILIDAFGENVFKVLEEEPNRLLTLSGINAKRKKQLLSNWSEQKSIREIMVFLQSHEISTARAVRIYKIYGDNAIAKVKENPYRLAKDIQSIGFKTADDLAIRMGLPLNSVERARAGLNHALQEHCQRGHCAAPYQDLIEQTTSLLDIPASIVDEALQKEIHEENLILEPISGVDCIFPGYLQHTESVAAKHLLRIQSGELPWEKIDINKAIPWVEEKVGLQLDDSQKQAIETVFSNKLTIITGGPGVGKTTIVHSILKLMQSELLSVALCAPTGRAAKRLTETTGLTAKTIHRLLAFNPETRSFKYNHQNPLPSDVILVDESSMVDIVLLYHLLKAIPDHAALIFVGDVDQLPAVGQGAVLLDMIASGIISTVRLTKIFRQASNSKIILNAHRINQGELPLANENGHNDFYSFYVDNQTDIHSLLLELVSARLPQYTGSNPMTEIQVLTPMNRGSLGTQSLNIALQKKLNGHSEPKVNRYGLTFAPGDKVIQTINNYEKEVFNGDIGFISTIQTEESNLKVIFDNHVVEYTFDELDELNLAYAISIHKSQGSEFPIVVMLLSMQHYLLLAKNLLYTGITRGKRLVVLIGEKKAISMAVKNDRENKRLTKLSQRLRENNE